MNDSGPRSRYYYTPAELYDLSYSPLVCVPPSFNKIAEGDIPGPPCLAQLNSRQPAAHQQSRRSRVGGSNSNNSSNSNSNSSGRRQDRRWVAGADVAEYYAAKNQQRNHNSHTSASHGAYHGAHHGAHHGGHHGHHNGHRQEEDTEETVGWLDITPDSKSTGFDGFEDNVAEFERWKESQKVNKSPPAKATDEVLLEEKKPVAKQEEPKEMKELWEAQIDVPQQYGSSSSRFSTFFQPSQQEIKQTESTEALNPQQTPQRLTQEGTPNRTMTPNSRNNLGHSGMQAPGIPMTSSPANMQPSTPGIPAPPPGMAAQPGISFTGRVPPGMAPPPGMSMPGMAPPGMMSPGMAPPGMVPSAMGIHGNVPHPGMSPRVALLGMAPPGMVAPGMAAPPGMAPPGMSPHLVQRMPPGMSPSRMQMGMNVSHVADDAFFSDLLARK